MQKNGYKLTFKEITDPVWKTHQTTIRVRQLRTRLILKYQTLLMGINKNKAQVEKRLLQIDIHQRKYFKISYINADFLENIKNPTTTFKA